MHLPESTESYYKVDGDDAQIKVYQDPALRAELDNAHILVGKPPGSTSAITQACDRHDVF